jgi:hypothetical protein
MCFVDWTFVEKNTESSVESLAENEAIEYAIFAYFLWNCQDRFLHIVLDGFEGNLQSWVALPLSLLLVYEGSPNNHKFV